MLPSGSSNVNGQDLALFPRLWPPERGRPWQPTRKRHTGCDKRGQQGGLEEQSAAALKQAPGRFASSRFRVCAFCLRLARLGRRQKGQNCQSVMAQALIRSARIEPACLPPEKTVSKWCTQLDAWCIVLVLVEASSESGIPAGQRGAGAKHLDSACGCVV